MNKELELKINKIIDISDESPVIFKAVLKKEMSQLDLEDVLDVVYIKREYTDIVKKSDIFSKAILLIATSFGLVVVEEGQDNTLLEYGGYRIRYVMYSKIKCLDFNTCLLVGHIKILTGASSEPDLLIEFNTSKLYTEVKNIVDIIRGKMIDCERKLMN